MCPAGSREGGPLFSSRAPGQKRGSPGRACACCRGDPLRPHWKDYSDPKAPQTTEAGQERLAPPSTKPTTDPTKWVRPPWHSPRADTQPGPVGGQQVPPPKLGLQMWPLDILLGSTFCAPSWAGSPAVLQGLAIRMQEVSALSALLVVLTLQEGLSYHGCWRATASAACHSAQGRLQRHLFFLRHPHPARPQLHFQEWASTNLEPGQGSPEGWEPDWSPVWESSHPWPKCTPGIILAVA